MSHVQDRASGGAMRDCDEPGRGSDVVGFTFLEWKLKAGVPGLGV